MARSLAVAVVAMSAGAMAFAPADVVKARLAGYREMGAAFKNVNDELRSPTPQPFILKTSTREIQNFARQQYGWFPAGSGPETGLKTAAKPEIWVQPAQFKAAQDELVKQANAFAAAATSGDVATMKVQARTLGQACAACHRVYRVPENR